MRSNTVPPAVRTPGSRAALVPVSNIPLDPRSASDPLLLASRPHCCAWFGSDLSSQRSTAIGRPSAHSALTAWSAAVLAFFVSVERLGMDSGPVRLTIEVNWSGLPVQWGFVVTLLAPPPWAPWPELEHTAARQVTMTSPASGTSRSARRADMMTPSLVTPAGFAFPKTTPDDSFTLRPLASWTRCPRWCRARPDRCRPKIDSARDGNDVDRRLRTAATGRGRTRWDPF